MNLDAILTAEEMQIIEAHPWGLQASPKRALTECTGIIDRLLSERATLWEMLDKVNRARFTPYHEALPWNDIAQAMQKAGRE